MVVIQQHKALVLKLNNPAQVLESIPTAKELDYKGASLVITPHRIGEARVLKNLGIRVPSPILHYYDWPGRFTPFAHQKKTASFLTMTQRGLVLNDIGTGKSLSALWAADFLMSQGVAKKCLIVSPLSTLQRVWGDAIFMNFPHRDFNVLHGSSTKRLKLLSQDKDFYVINHDGFQVIHDECVGMFDIVLVDEAAVLRNPSTQRYKLFRKWLDRNPQAHLWMMTGTPTPNDPTDAWALAKLIKSPYLSKTYTAFREQTMMKVGQWKWVPRPEAVEIVRHVLQPAVRFTRDDCLDLPETVIQTREVALTKDQKEHYNRMFKTLVTEVQGAGITAVNEAVKVQKLVQIACGVAYGDDGQHISVDCAPRVKEVSDIIEEAGEKVIVFVPLTGTLKMLESELSKRWSVGVVNGSVPAPKRNDIFSRFQNYDDPRVLIAHPETMAHGLTLTAASTIIWYGPVNSNETYTQANGRIERIGKRHVSNVIHIAGTDLERKMYERLAGKQKLQGLLLDLIKQQTEK